MAARVSKADFEEKVLKEALPVLVDFYSDSCVACKKLAEQYEVQANPTLIFFQNGQAKDRKTGALKQAELNSWIEEQL